MALFRGDIKAAWKYNPAILCLMLPGMAVTADLAVRYVKEGKLYLHRWANILVYIMIGVLLAFGVWRNLPC